MSVKSDIKERINNARTASADVSSSMLGNMENNAQAVFQAKTNAKAMAAFEKQMEYEAKGPLGKLLHLGNKGTLGIAGGTLNLAKKAGLIGGLTAVGAVALGAMSRGGKRGEGAAVKEGLLDAQTAATAAADPMATSPAVLTAEAATPSLPPLDAPSIGGIAPRNAMAEAMERGSLAKGAAAKVANAAAKAGSGLHL